MSRIGANPTLRTTAADFELLDEHKDEDGRVWLYVKALGTRAVNDLVVVDEDGGITNAANSSLFGERCGLTTAAFTINQYGWVCIEGTGTDILQNVLASAAANAQLTTTATAGKLDDAAGVGTKNIDGLIIITADGGSGSAIQAILTRPTVGATN